MTILQSDVHYDNNRIADDSYRLKVCNNAYKLASSVASEINSYSKIIDSRKEQEVTRFDRDEIILGDLLGSGGFSNVFALDNLDLLPESDDATSNNQQQDRRRMVMAQSAKPDQYAVKFLKYEELINNMNDYCNGAADLVIETKILANMTHHKNIIRLHGVSESGISGLAEDVEGSYFLVLDRLTATLSDRILEWKSQPIETTMINKLKVAYDLSYALKHVHMHNIVFRDLKPDNVGFDKNGTLKLFDFGLAKELHPKQLVSNEKYKMSGATGSLRYMAPEVALSKPYGLSADVYSYAILFWEMMSTQEAFMGMTMGQHQKFVLRGSHRPKIRTDEWSDKICKILKWSWIENPSDRPTFKDIKKALYREVQRIQQQEERHVPIFENGPHVKKIKTSIKRYQSTMDGTFTKTINLEVENDIKLPTFKNFHQPKQDSLCMLAGSPMDIKIRNPIAKTRDKSEKVDLQKALEEAVAIGVTSLCKR